MARRHTAFRAALAAALAVAGSVPVSLSAGAQERTADAPAVTRPSETNAWYLRTSLTSGTATNSFRYGRGGERQLMGDWDGDGVVTPGVVRFDRWYLRNSNTSGPADVSFTFEPQEYSPGVPVVGDWDGDGIDTPGYVVNFTQCVINGHEECRPAGSRWELRNSNTSGTADRILRFDGNGDPVVGDWDGDGSDNLGVTSNARWSLDTNGGGAAEHVFIFGRDSDVGVAGDWDGNGTDDPGVFRDGHWYLRHDLSGGVAHRHFSFGRQRDRPYAWR